MELHQLAELGKEEWETQKYLLSHLSGLHCKLFTPTPTAVVAYFDVGKKKTLCFRSDMDALPIPEQSGYSFASKNPKVSHACGHDGHMAMLLAYAIWASSHRSSLTSNIVCLFQPSEENEAGANEILKSGILEKLHVDEIYGMHLWPTLEKGKLYTYPKGMLARSAEITLDFIGKSVHAANRDQGIDALYYASSFLLEFYRFSESIKPLHLLSFGKLESGTVRNSVPETAHLEGTMRALDDDVFEQMKDFMLSLIEKYRTHLSIRFQINDVYPLVYNDPQLIEKLSDPLSLQILNHPYLQAEDFGCYTRKYPCLFLLLGCGDTPLLHTPQFDFDMDILSVGVEAYQKISSRKNS